MIYSFHDSSAYCIHKINKLVFNLSVIDRSWHDYLQERLIPPTSLAGLMPEKQQKADGKEAKLYLNRRIYRWHHNLFINLLFIWILLIAWCAWTVFMDLLQVECDKYSFLVINYMKTQVSRVKNVKLFCITVCNLLRYFDIDIARYLKQIMCSKYCPILLRPWIKLTKWKM